MARNGHADCIAQCPLSGAKRKTFARIELFRFWILRVCTAAIAARPILEGETDIAADNYLSEASRSVLYTWLSLNVPKS
jgi:hypothetical protein